MEEHKASKIGEMLVRDGVISDLQLSEALIYQQSSGRSWVKF